MLTNHLPFRVPQRYFLPVLWAALLLPSLSQAQAPSEALDKLSAFTSHLQTLGEITGEDITAKLPFGSYHKRAMSTISYEKLLQCFEKHFSALQDCYPPNSFAFSASSVSKSFRGEKTIDFIESYFRPFLFFTSAAYNPDYMRYEKFKLSYEGKEIYGLRVRTEILPILKSKSLDSPVPFLYTESFSARVFGFTHAQLVPSLSSNIEPADQFLYNDLMNWEKHRRYKKLDQVSGPLKLTNFAHASGDDYLVSDHPDFALQSPEFKTKPIRMTFFLWRNDAVSTWLSRFVKPERRIPDFIFQVDYENRG